MSGQLGATPITKRTNGQVTFQFYYGESLLAGKEAASGVGKGMADIARISCPYTPGLFPLSMLLTMPGLNIDAVSATRAMVDLYGSSQYPQFREEYDKLRLKLLTPQNSPRTGFAVKGKIRNVTDLKGKKIRVFGSEWPVVLSEAYGVNPISMGWGDVVEALMRGTIDGLISPISTYSDYKLGQYLGTVINGDLGLPNLGALVMNQKSWDALPDDVKRVFNEEISSFAMNMHRNWHSVSEKIMLDYAKQAGMIIYEMTPDEKALLGNPIKMVWKKSIDDLEKKGIPASRILEAYQAAKGKGR